MALDYALDHAKQIAIVGDKNAPATNDFFAALHGKFLPNKVVAFSDSVGAEHTVPLVIDKTRLNNKTTFYVCENGTCQTPETDPQIAMNKVLERKIYSI